MGANLFQAYLQPVRSVADYGAEMDRADANAITLQTARQQNALQAVAAREAQADQNALQRIAAQARTSDDLVTGLRQSGRPALMMQADKIEQGALSRRKTEADIGETSAKTDTAKFELGQKRRQVALGKVVSAGSHQNALQAVQDAFSAGELDQGEAQALYTNLQDPAQFAKVIRGIQLRQLSPDAAYKAMTPDLKTVDLGGTTQVVDMNADTRGGAPVSLKKTQTPDSVASVAATLRGQTLADARAREANDTQRQLVMQEKGLKVAQLQDQADQRQRTRDAGVSNIANQIAVIDKALAHPGRETATGMSGTVDPRNYLPGTDAADFRAVLDQVGGAAFLQAFESLKGGGQITEVEGKKATDAMARLSRAQSDAEFKRSLEDLRQVMTTGYKRLAGQDYAGSSAGVPPDIAAILNKHGGK